MISDPLSAHVARLEELVRAATLVSDPISKEMRQNPVLVNPLLASRVRVLSAHLGLREQREPVKISRCHVCRSDHFLRDKDTDNFILSGVYLSLDDPSGPYPIVAKLSNATVLPVLERVMDSYWRSRIRCNTIAKERPPSLLTLLHEQGSLTGSSAMFRREALLQRGGFLDDLVTLALEGAAAPLLEGSLPDIFRGRWNRPPSLLLKKKFYYARADWRAYFVDSNPDRALVGAILQAVLLPSGSRRSRLSSESIYPSKGKNELDLRIEMSRDDTCSITMGDVSSFTASNVNTWVVALVQLLLILTPGLSHLDTPRIAFVLGQPLEFRLSEVLSIYLFETVFASFTTADRPGVHFAHGGYLGVNANMCLSMLSFCLHVDDYQRQLGQGGLRSRVQLGGDDFILIEYGREELYQRVHGLFLERTSCYIGSLKEPIREMVTFVEPRKRRLLGRFCKKGVNILLTNKRNRELLELRTEFVLPVLEALVDHLPRDKTRREKIIKVLRMGVVSASLGTPYYGAAVTLYNELLEVIHGPMDFGPLSRNRHPRVEDLETVVVDGIRLTPLAYGKASRLPQIVSTSGTVFRSTLSECLRWLIGERDLLTVEAYDQQGRTILIYLTVVERSRFFRGMPRVVFPEPYDPSFLPGVARIAHLYSELRSILN